jgi:hypothetical protein
MSRRTKFIILGIFLVLLAIPAVYAVLTWQPENPLHFRIVKDQGPQEAFLPRSGLAQAFVVEVRNASSVPVELFGMLLYQQTSAAKSSRAMIGEIGHESLLPPGFTSSGSYDLEPIPPGGTAYYMAQVAEGMDIRHGKVEVFYTWVSLTKGNCMRWTNQMVNLLPMKLQMHMPCIELTEDETIVEVSLLSTSPAPHPDQTPAPQ